MESIAIIGIGCRVPGAASPRAFWELLENRVDAISEVPESRWRQRELYDPRAQTPGKMNTMWAGILKDVEEFDYEFFGIPVREAIHMDPQQRLVLEVAWEALEHAGQSADRLRGSDTGVFVGISSDDYSRLFSDFSTIDAYSGTGNALSVAANRLSYVFDFRGPSWVVDTACSSSLVAIHQACQSLRARECSLAVAGGVNLLLTPQLTIAFSQAGMMSPRGRCRAFDDSADGYVRGEGCGLVVLKRLSEALRDRDNILALVRGSAVNQDGRTNGLTSPNGLSQQAVIRQALLNAGVSPKHISYVEAHGTGTSLGDPIEMRSLMEALMPGRSEAERCWVGSVKTNIGHLEAAAGVAGLIKVVLALVHKTIPPQLHLAKLNRYISLEGTPFRIPVEAEPWPGEQGHRLAGVSSFGFAGTNAHIILQERPSRQEGTRPAERPRHLLTLSARDKKTLRALAGSYAEVVGDRTDLPDLCYSANTGRSHFRHRLALAGPSAPGFQSSLRRFADQESAVEGVSVYGASPSSHRPKVGFLFTGQGSQYVGMGRELYERQPTFRRVLERCDGVFRSATGESLIGVMYERADGAEWIDRTAYAQPALFAVEMGLAELWRSWGIEPGVVMGHSVGEYAAACVSGVFGIEDAMRLVCARGRLMQGMAAGTMVAVFAERAEVEEVVRSRGSEVAIAAVNGPRHVVISGVREATDGVVGELGRRGVRFQPLKVSHAFHSPMMTPMLEDYLAVAREVTYGPPAVDLISNVTGEAAKEEVTRAEYWVEHVQRPVQFERGMRTMQAASTDVFLEVGPKPTLLALGRECLEKDDGLWLESLRPGVSDWQQMLKSLSSLYVAGCDVSWTGFDQDYLRRREVLPTYPFQRKRCWLPDAQSPSTSPGPARRGAGHPLLGRRIDLAGRQDEFFFESQISCDRPHFLQDHRVNGMPVFPASGYLEMALSAGSATGDPSLPLVLENVVFARPLVLLSGYQHPTQLHLQKRDRDLWSFQIHASSIDSEGQSAPWVPHASGTLRANGEEGVGGGVLDLRALSGSFIDEVNMTDIFELFRKHGNEYGPAFRALDRVWKQDRRSLGRIRLPESCLSQSESYRFHPVLLDACFQLVGIACSRFDETGADPWLPVGVDRLVVSDRPGVELWGLAETSSLDSESAVADVTILTPEGKPVGRVSNLRLKRVKLRAPQTETGDVGQWLYRVEWRPDETTAAESFSEPMASPGEIHDHLEGLLQSIADECDLPSYRDASRALSRVSVRYVSTAFASLGWDLRRGARFSLEAKAEELAVAEPYRRLFRRLVEILAEEDVVASNGSEWEVMNPEAGRHETPPVFDRRALIGAELALLERCGPRLAEVLQGKCDPVELLFAGGDLSLARALYETSAGARAMNRLVQESVSAAARRLQGRRRLRVLEIGAGTGGTTSAILSSVSPELIDYVFTDISPWFTSKARERFGGLPFLQFKVLDIERDPTDQGFRAGHFDVVVAANVFHATRDLRKTLENSLTLLNRGGLLVLLEGTKPVRWVDLVFGLTEGWWRFSDTDLRPSYPLLSTAAWSSVLREAGFSDVRSVSPFVPEDGVESAVILAQAHGSQSGETTAPSRWLICADRQGVGEELAKRLRARGQVCHLVFAGREFSALGDDDYEVNVRNHGDFERLFSSLTARTPTDLQGLVFLWSLDAEEIEDPHRMTCGSVLYLIQALGSARFQRPPAVWLVTRGAVPASGVMGAAALSQAPLWGMAKVVALEHPELRCRRVDLDPDDDGDVTETLLSELVGHNSEGEIAIRDGIRHVARLVRHDLAFEEDRAEPPSFRADASYLITGGLGGLGLLVAEWMVRHGAREIVLIGRGRGDEKAPEVIRALNEGGARVTAIEADVTDRAALADVMKQIDKNMSRLRGVVHAAGVLDDGILLNLSWDRFERVLAPKTVGAWNLHALTADRSLDFFVLFSSTASVFGSPGQANHAAANAYLDALAHARHAMGLPGSSINWGAWSEVGSAVATGVDSRLQTRGVGTISPPLGLKCLARILSSSTAQVAVAPVDWAEFHRVEGGSAFFSDLRPLRTTSRVAISVREQLDAVPTNQKRGFLLEHVRSQVASVRGVPSEEIDLTRGLVELGLDSLMAIDLRKSLEESLACSLPSTIAFDYPTVEALVDYMARDVLRLDGVAAGVPTVSDPRTELSAVMDGLSEDEVASRLNEKLASLKRGRTE